MLLRGLQPVQMDVRHQELAQMLCFVIMRLARVLRDIFKSNAAIISTNIFVMILVIWKLYRMM